MANSGSGSCNSVAYNTAVRAGESINKCGQTLKECFALIREQYNQARTKKAKDQVLIDAKQGLLTVVKPNLANKHMVTIHQICGKEMVLFASDPHLNRKMNEKEVELQVTLSLGTLSSFRAPIAAKSIPSVSSGSTSSSDGDDGSPPNKRNVTTKKLPKKQSRSAPPRSRAKQMVELKTNTRVPPATPLPSAAAEGSMFHTKLTISAPLRGIPEDMIRRNSCNLTLALQLHSMRAIISWNNGINIAVVHLRSFLPLPSFLLLHHSRNHHHHHLQCAEPPATHNSCRLKC